MMSLRLRRSMSMSLQISRIESEDRPDIPKQLTDKFTSFTCR